jgi:hypothetical protein
MRALPVTAKQVDLDTDDVAAVRRMKEEYGDLGAILEHIKMYTFVKVWTDDAKALPGCQHSQLRAPTIPGPPCLCVRCRAAFAAYVSHLFGG